MILLYNYEQDIPSNCKIPIKSEPLSFCDNSDMTIE